MEVRELQVVRRGALIPGVLFLFPAIQTLRADGPPES